MTSSIPLAKPKSDFCCTLYAGYLRGVFLFVSDEEAEYTKDGF